MAAPARPFKIRAMAELLGTPGIGRMYPGQTVTVTAGTYRQSLDDSGESWLDRLSEDEQRARWGEIRGHVVPAEE